MESVNETVELGPTQILVVLTYSQLTPRCSAMFDGRTEVCVFVFFSWDLYPLLPVASANQANLQVLIRFAPSARYPEHTAPIRHTERLLVCFLEWFGWKDPVQAASRLSQASMQVGCETSSVVNAHSTRGVALLTAPFSALSIIGYTVVNYGACGPFWPFLWA